MTTYVCTTCKRRLGESDVIIADVRSDVGWKHPDGTVDYPMITKRFCWKHVPSTDHEGTGSFRNAERATYAPSTSIDRTPDPDRPCVFDGGWCVAAGHDHDRGF